MMKYLSTTLFCYFCVLLSFSQEVLPELSDKLKNQDKKILPSKINALYSQNKSKDKTELDLWRFYWFDSIKERSTSDSLAQLIDISKLKIQYRQESLLYYRLGNIEVDKNQFEKAISHFHDGLKVAEKFNSPIQTASFKREIGKTYLKLDQYNDAIPYLKASYDISKKINDSIGIANACISLGNAYKEIGKLDEGEKNYKISLEIAQKLKNERLIAGNYNNLGNVERRRENYEKALEYFKLALEMNIQSNNLQWQSFNYHNLGNTYRDLKQFHKSIEYFKKANEIKIEINDSLNLRTGYLGLSEVYAEVHDYKNAYFYLNQYEKINKILGLSEQASMLKDLEAKYMSENQALEIDRLKAVEALQREKNEHLEVQSSKNYKLMMLSILAGLILLGGVALLWRSNRLKVKINELLNSKNNQIQISNHALQQALTELSTKNKEIIDSINYATYIQRASLPNISQHTSDKLIFELFYQPKDIVSGDFYFSYEQYNRSIFGIADCTGHGVPGAMVSLIGMNSIDKIVREIKNEKAQMMVLNLNKQVVENLQRGGDQINDGMDISFCIVDHESKELSFSGANHNAYILRGKENSNADLDLTSIRDENETHFLIELKGSRRPIGNTYSDNRFTEINFQLYSSDRILLLTDGYPDQIGGEKDKKFKKNQLMHAILETANLNITAQLKHLQNEFYIWKGDNEQIDDVCLLITQVK